ncbi:uncharacterized protein [Rutidosis leptorrhynchoides]|uniref:uncharacterized protein n=1 Tax=Rutidosis leptorrhynchoides TaxID=125765 RepID=UPI003A99E2CE
MEDYKHGDNEVREEVKRFHCDFLPYRVKRFNEFIENNKLIEITMGGKWFRRISDDGLKMSKLDRFLVTKKFLNLWNNVSAIALERKASDHCPIVLRDKIVDFGPKPFKLFNEWFFLEGVHTIRENAWKIKVKGHRQDCVF